MTSMTQLKKYQIEEIFNLDVENEERPQMIAIQKRKQIMRVLS